MSQTLTLSRVHEAIARAARDNAMSHCAEVALAERLDAHPEILTARLGRIRYVCGMLGITPGAALLDVGAGIGINSILALMCGVEEVHSVEMSEDRYRSARLMLEDLGLQERMHLHTEDVLALELPACSMDAAFSFELLEHVSDLAGLYRKLARWMKPGARVYGRTGANGRNVIYRHTFRKTWARIDEENYTAARADLIRGIAPAAPADVVAILVERTRGEMVAGISQVTREYLRSGTLPAPRPPCAPRDPRTGQYMERLLDPFGTAAVMNTQGFETSLLAPCFSNITTTNPWIAGAYKGAGAVIRALFPASLVVAPWLEFLSRKIGPRPAT